jgi:hypothetical protein
MGQDPQNAARLRMGRDGGADHEQRSADRKQRPREREARCVGVHERDRDRRQTARRDPAQRARRARDPEPALMRLEQQRARRQLPEAAEDQIERPLGLQLGLHRAHREREQRQRGQRETRRATERARGAASAHPEEQDQREDGVELLLHRERPGMRERVELRLGREVAVGEVDQREVAQTEEGPQRSDIVDLADPRQRHHRGRGQRDREQTDDQRREDAQHTSRVEAREELPRGTRGVAHQRARDHVAGDREEDVDPGEAARQQRGQAVEDEHAQHRDRAQPVDRRNVRVARAQRFHLASAAAAGSRAPQPVGSRGLDWVAAATSDASARDGSSVALRATQRRSAFVSRADEEIQWPRSGRCRS